MTAPIRSLLNHFNQPITALKHALKRQNAEEVSKALKLFKENPIVLPHKTAKELAAFNLKRIIQETDNKVSSEANQKLSNKK